MKIKHQITQKHKILEGDEATYKKELKKLTATKESREKNANRIQEINTAISLTADIEELKVRLLKRSGQDNRSDDLPSIIDKRQKIYWIQTAPILKYYKSKDLLKEVDGFGSIKQVNKRILDIIDSND